jgi:hypothetical protein
MEYTPDIWHLIKIKTPQETLYKVLAGWYGGFAGADTWKINSGIPSYTIAIDGSTVKFHGYSGSTYICNIESEKVSLLTLSIFDNLNKQLQDRYGDTHSMELISYQDFKSEFTEKS